MSVLVGKKAPDFNVAAVLGNGEIVESFTLSEAIKGKYGLVFFYPLDFTFVCPSESSNDLGTASASIATGGPQLVCRMDECH